MTPEEARRAQRAVACRHWRWMPGMRMVDGTRVVVVVDGVPFGVYEPEDGGNPLAISDALSVGEDDPDFDDPATLGCVRHLIVEAGGDPDAFGGTYAEALVAALEAAP